MSHFLVFIRHCSACQSMVKHFTVRTFIPALDSQRERDSHWTDGKNGFQMRIGVCPYCGALLWIDEQIIHPRDNYEPEFKDVLYVKPPTFKDFRSLLDPQILGDRDQERYVRLRLWWLDNDCRRKGSPRSPKMSTRERSNIEVLADLLASDDYDLLLKAEIMRELGRFAECLALLDQIIGDVSNYRTKFIRKLAEIGDMVVGVLA
jgi:hypothetical protein